MLEKKVTEPSQSEWASPVVIIPKPDGSLRFCVDYRKLNSLTLKDTYPLTRIDECLASLVEANYFTALDLNAGYWQLPIAPEDKENTTFTCHAGCHQVCRIPFGLCIAPATFQRAVDILLAKFRWKTCLVYLDDIIVFSNSLVDHLKHVEEVMRVLCDSKVTLKLPKCTFSAQSVDYLGHRFHPGKLEVASKNLKALEGFKEPRNHTQLRSFIVLCNVYRRFVPKFARVAAPLTALPQKGQDFELEPFTDEQREAFELLKKALANPPILRLPRMDLPFSVDTDACEYQVGCALMQTHEDGKRYPFGFWSRKRSGAELNYSVGGKECLDIVWACQILRLYLERTLFELYTYHQALKWLMTLTDATGRLARWRLKFSELDFSVQYRKGAKNNIADSVSRLPTYDYTEKITHL